MRKIIQCTKCGIDTRNPKFCSLKCSASYNNKILKKRKLKNQCRKCCKPIYSGRTYCAECLKTLYNVDYTLGEVKYKHGKKCNIYTLVRTRSRSVLKHRNIIACENCGYDKCIEACHIKPVSSFDDSVRLSVINDFDNLVGLCPNCHWELDHNILSSEQLLKNRRTKNCT